MKELDNTIKEIVYEDAHYSYVKNNEPPKGNVVNYGRIVSKTKSFVDIEIKWTNKPHDVLFGLVIPVNAISRKISIVSDQYLLNDQIAVYWNDVFVYDEKYKQLREPTKMLTEGRLIIETSTYIILDNPETLNLKTIKNHPEKKPLRYYIPKSMISEIRIVESNE